MKIPAKVANKAKQISVLLMDVDGTLTDGSVTLASTPDNHALEVKTFDAHDGQGLSLAVTAGRPSQHGWHRSPRRCSSKMVQDPP